MSRPSRLMSSRLGDVGSPPHQKQLANLALAECDNGRGFSFLRPLVQHARSLADGHADPRPMLCPTIENAFDLVQAAAREQQLDYALAVSAPLLDLVEIAMVRDQGLVSFFVGLVAHAARATTSRLRTNCSTSRLRRSRSTSISCDAGIKWPGYIASRSGSRLGKRRSFVP